MTHNQEYTLRHIDVLESSCNDAKQVVGNIRQQLETKYDIQANPDDYFNPDSDLTVSKSLIRNFTGKLKKEIAIMQSTFEEIEKELTEI